MKHLIRLLLLLLAVAGLVLLGPFGFAFAVGVALFDAERGADYLSSLVLVLAIGTDQLINVVCGPMFNLILIANQGYQFGNVKETVSRVLGKNKQRGTLRRTGNVLADLLNWIDKGHVERAATD